MRLCMSHAQKRQAYNHRLLLTPWNLKPNQAMPARCFRRFNLTWWSTALPITLHGKAFTSLQRGRSCSAAQDSVLHCHCRQLSQSSLLKPWPDIHVQFFLSMAVTLTQSTLCCEPWIFQSFAASAILLFWRQRSELHWVLRLTSDYKSWPTTCIYTHQSPKWMKHRPGLMESVARTWAACW